MNIKRDGKTTGRFPKYRLIVDGVDLGQVNRKISKGKDGNGGAKEATGKGVSPAVESPSPAALQQQRTASTAYTVSTRRHSVQRAQRTLRGE